VTHGGCGTTADVSGQVEEPRKEVEDPEVTYIRRQFKLLLYRLQVLPEAVRARLQGHLTEGLLEKTFRVDTPRGALSFVALGRTGAGRGTSLLTKQPATIEWIDGFRPNSVFWDVGANVGVYTMYAALRGDTRIVAFEPAAVNYFLLVANCQANQLDDRVQCVLAGLGSRPALESIEVSQFSAGQSFSFHGKPHRPFAGRQSALVMTIDQLVDDYGLACPNYLKIDVPDMTADVLDGGIRTLRRRELREVHVEVDDRSGGGSPVIERLERCGLVLTRRDAHGIADLTFTRPGV
jgi:FkbM family methyltransferase